MRAAQVNHYRTHQEILQYALDSSPTNPQVEISQTPRLAAYTRNSVSEIAQLSGIYRLMPKQGKVWQINGEWLERAAFLQLSHSPICPKCLQETPYLRGECHLAFYTACWLHECQLISRCPQCHRQLTSNRRLPERCVCHFDLRKSRIEGAKAEELLVAKLIANRYHGPLILGSDSLPTAQIENLARLTLEGLCHSLWFLGHHLPGNFQMNLGTALRKLNREEIIKMTQGVCWLLSDWPNRLKETLAKRMRQNSAWSGSNATTRLLGPVQRYFETYIAPSDTRFITKPYETFVRQLIVELGKKHRASRIDSPQIEFQFD